MLLKKAIRLCGVYLLAATMLWVPTVAQAEMLSTQKTLQSLTNNAAKRELLTSMVLRKEVQAQLQEYGVSRAESLNRVNSMTDNEVASVIYQIELYAGAGGECGVRTPVKPATLTGCGLLNLELPVALYGHSG